MLQLWIPALLVATAGPAAERYAVDPARSSVGFEGHSTLHDFEGRSSDLSGELRIDVEHPERLAGGIVTLRATSLDTDNGGRDSNMRDHLEVESFPTIEYHLDRARGTLADGAGHLALSGRFTIHGVTRRHDLEVDVEPLDGGALSVRGRTPLRMTDFGIKPPRVMVVTVEDEVEAWIDITIVPVPTEYIPAEGLDLSVTERVTPVDGAAEEHELAERLFWATRPEPGPEGPAATGEPKPALTLWEREEEGEWFLAREGGAFRIRLVEGTCRSAASECDAAFADAARRRDSLQTRLARMDGGGGHARIATRVRATLERIAKGLRLAPGDGAAEVRREGDTVRITLGGKTWATLEGLAGDAPLGAALALLPDLPGAVADALAGIRGVPRRAVLEGALPSGTRELELAFGRPHPASLPAWAFDPGIWTPAEEASSARR